MEADLIVAHTLQWCGWSHPQGTKQAKILADGKE